MTRAQTESRFGRVRGTSIRPAVERVSSPADRGDVAGLKQLARRNRGVDHHV